MFQKQREIFPKICYTLCRFDSEHKGGGWDGAERDPQKGAGAGRRRSPRQLSGGRLAGIDRTGLAPADHHRHQRRQPERRNVRAGPVRDGAGYVDEHPQSGRDGAAGRNESDGAASVPAGHRAGGRHGRHPAGRDRGAGVGRRRPPRVVHPVRPRHRGKAGPETPRAAAGRDPGRESEGLPAGLGGLFSCAAGQADRWGAVPRRRLPG